MIEWLTDVGVQFRKKEDGSYLRTRGFGQPGKWWILIRDGQYMKPLIAKKIREIGVDVLDNVMITRLVVKDGRMVGAMGYNVLNGEFHVIRCKTAVLALGPRATRVTTNSTRNPFNAQFPSHNTGAQYILAYEAGARIGCLDTRQIATVLPRASAAGHERPHGRRRRSSELQGRAPHEEVPSHAGAGSPSSFCAGTCAGADCRLRPRLFIWTPAIFPGKVSACLRKNSCPATRPHGRNIPNRRACDLYNKLMEVEIGDLALEALVLRDEHFESNISGLFVGTGFQAFFRRHVRRLCGRESMLPRRAEAIDAVPDVSAGEAERNAVAFLLPCIPRAARIMRSLKAPSDRSWTTYMGYVRNERGMKQALDSLARIEALKDDLIADNWHELMRTHEALVLLEMCKLVTLASIEHSRALRHPTAPFICVPTTPIPIPP